MPACSQLICQEYQAAFKPVSAEHVLVQGYVLSQVQNLIFLFVDLQEVLVNPLLQSFKVPLGGGENARKYSFTATKFVMVESNLLSEQERR